MDPFSHDLKGTLFCLKIDIANRMGESVLGINVQYLKQSEIVVRTLGMVQINCKHTGQNLKCMIIDVLNRCGLDINNVYLDNY